MPGAQEEAQVSYLAVARLRDQAVLLSYFNPAISSRERSQIETVFFEEIHKPNAAIPGSRRVSDVGQGVNNRIYILTDTNAICVYVACLKEGQDDYSLRYPVTTAWELCEDMRKSIEASGVRLDDVPAEGLSRPNRKRMKEIMSKYNNPTENNKTARVKEKVDEVHGVMQDNVGSWGVPSRALKAPGLEIDVLHQVRRIIENQETTESLGRRTEDMNRQAHIFLRQSADLKRQMQIRNIKLRIILAIIVICIIVYIIVPIVRR
ncbi:hypothetical protein FOL47_005701 [Perkinsus chesapeaki]|uniref:V-SNARE coiled-coil homology domain-containing protein n=1 Tax=Perkinsus chesapeaki TaxID=330153 RepID=A0A7J6LWH5_PERCH|nr:hypothetical protein FOL47_005701 [Perkinsus chesapeaki]